MFLFKCLFTCSVFCYLLWSIFVPCVQFLFVQMFLLFSETYSDWLTVSTSSPWLQPRLHSNGTHSERRHEVKASFGSTKMTEKLNPQVFVWFYLFFYFSDEFVFYLFFFFSDMFMFYLFFYFSDTPHAEAEGCGAVSSQRSVGLQHFKENMSAILWSSSQLNANIKWRKKRVRNDQESKKQKRSFGICHTEITTVFSNEEKRQMNKKERKTSEE